MAEFDVVGALRRIRRAADVSQRELARRCGVATSVIAHAEAGRRGLAVDLLSRAAAVAGLRLVLLAADGTEAVPMADAAVRDAVGRRYPAHLDTRHGDEDWWHGEERYSRRQPWYTFDRDRWVRDEWRRRRGTPDDHQIPQPGDDPRTRKAARRAEAQRRLREDWERRVAAGEVDRVPDFECTCPPECDELDEGLRPVHAEGCPCRCDVD